jgi:hypothetical protein
MSDVRIGYLSKYSIWDTSASPAAYFELGEVTEINPGDESVDRVEVTHYQSPDRRREYISGLIDSGEASFTINWIPGSETDEFIRALQVSAENRDHRIEFPNGVHVTFTGQIMAFTKAVPLDDRMSATITVAKSGGETWGGGTP